MNKTIGNKIGNKTNEIQEIWRHIEDNRVSLVEHTGILNNHSDTFDKLALKAYHNTSRIDGIESTNTDITYKLIELNRLTNKRIDTIMDTVRLITTYGSSMDYNRVILWVFFFWLLIITVMVVTT